MARGDWNGDWTRSKETWPMEQRAGPGGAVALGQREQGYRGAGVQRSRQAESSGAGRLEQGKQRTVPREAVVLGQESRRTVPGEPVGRDRGRRVGGLCQGER